jgi:hypothetical protein
MADVRPPSWPTNAPRDTAVAKTPARSAAQAAFFQAALGGQSISSQPTPQPPPARAARAPDLTIQMPREEPTKILRPGSIINIVV